MTDAQRMLVAPRLEALTEVNLGDLVAAFGWERRRLRAWMLRRLCLEPAREFARQMLAYDAAIGQRHGLPEASRLLLRERYVRALRVDGRDHCPASGPALFVANHPGLTDTLSLIAAIGREDLKIVAARRPFLELLTNVAAHIFFIDANLGRRVIAAHEIADHLRRGGAVLTFPAGGIEPDPDVDVGALGSVDRWSDSVRVIARMVPDARIVPVLVRGVVCGKSARHWLARRKRNPAERDKLGAALQLLAMVSRGTRPTAVAVRFAAPIAAGVQEIETLHGEIARRMRHMIVEARNLSDDVAIAIGNGRDIGAREIAFGDSL
jgi:hypothetical protein